jgi:uncharacterized protein YodC (DUF2158 family)
MTVSKLREWQGRTEANCDWFDGTKMQYGSFPVTSLKVVEERSAGSRQVEPYDGGDSTSWMR